METRFIAKENNSAKFTMDFSAEEFDKACTDAYRETRGNYAINGFRKGKAPRSIIERHYGEGVFFEDAINTLLREAYPKALEELDLEVIDSPQASFSELGKGKGLTVTIDVSVFPIVDVQDYKEVEAEEIVYTVSDEDIDKEIETMRKRNARIVPVEREAKEGDTLILDYAGFTGDEQFEGGTAENQQLKLGSGTFIPGFEDQLIGAKAGENVDVTVTFPEKYAEDLAGKEAVFHCTVHEVKEEELPEIDDEFAKDVSEYDTVEELKASIRDRLQETADLRAKNEAIDKIMEKVYEANKVEAPESLVRDEITAMYNELTQNLSYQGMTIDQYLSFTQKSREDFMNELRPEAEKRVSKRIILRSIAEAEGIEASDEDVEKEFEKLAKAYGNSKEDVKRMIGDENMTYFRRDIRMQNVMDSLYREAKLTKISDEEMEERRRKEAAEKEEEAASRNSKPAEDTKTTAKKEAKDMGPADADAEEQ